MTVDKELLEKYHLDTCTAEERRQVEDWLFNTETEDLDESVVAGKNIHKMDMWNEIKTILPEEIKPESLPYAAGAIRKNNVYFMWKGAIAASVFIAASAALLYFVFAGRPNHELVLTSFVNTSSHQVKYVDSRGYSASVGPNTMAKINREAGVTDLTGSILISPKRDIELSYGAKENIILKKGQTYIILKNGAGEGGVMVISERNLLDLPPVIQKQLTTQFGI